MENLTSEIKRIIDLPINEVDIYEAAMILLRINRNQILYSNLVRKNDKEKAVYELKKIYDFRMQDEALKDTARMEMEVQKIVAEMDEELKEMPKGKREDHDELPDEIKVVFLENLNVFRRMRKLHEQLKLMNNHKPCDRYPYLKELLQLDKQHRENWKKYDAFKLSDNPATETDKNKPDSKTVNTPQMENSELKTGSTEGPKTVDPKKVSAARKYLSDNKKKVETLEGEVKIELIKKMQERYNYLIATDSGVSDEQKAEYKALGLNV